MINAIVEISGDTGEMTNNTNNNPANRRFAPPPGYAPLPPQNISKKKNIAPVPLMPIQKGELPPLPDMPLPPSNAAMLYKISLMEQGQMPTQPTAPGNPRVLGKADFLSKEALNGRGVDSRSSTQQMNVPPLLQTNATRRAEESFFLPSSHSVGTDSEAQQQAAAFGDYRRQEPKPVSPQHPLLNAPSQRGAYESTRLSPTDIAKNFKALGSHAKEAYEFVQRIQASIKKAFVPRFDKKIEGRAFRHGAQAPYETRSFKTTNTVEKGNIIFLGPEHDYQVMMSQKYVNILTDYSNQYMKVNPNQYYLLGDSTRKYYMVDLILPKH